MKQHDYTTRWTKMRHNWLALKNNGLIHSWTFQEGGTHGNSACGMWRFSSKIGGKIKSTNRRCKSCEHVLAQ